MATTIKLKNSVTTTNAPSSLVQGEVAINITDKKVWVGNAATTPIQLLGDGGSVQFTTVDTTNLQVTNIKAKDGTASASIANSTGAFTVAAAFAANGGATLGDASGDALTINSSAVSIPNGLNFDSNTFVIDATNNNVGIGTSSPSYKLDVNGVSRVAGLRQTFETNLYTVDGALSNYSATNGVYLNGNAAGWLRLSGDGTNASYVQVVGASAGTAPNTVQFVTASSERMRIDSSGNVGIGTSSPTSKVGVISDGVPATSGNMSTGLYVGASNSYGINIGGSSSGAYAWINAAFLNNSGTAAPLVLATGSTERMRITSGGNVLVGKTTSNFATAGVEIANTINGDWNFWTTNTATSNTDGNIAANQLTSGAWILKVHYNGNEVGGVRLNGTTATQFPTSSDYRLKDNITPLTGALEKVSLLKPCQWTWKSDGSTSEGFIAHELQEVCPDAVCGEKDAVKNDGTILPQGVDTSFLVATLTAAIQEQQAMIEELKQEVAALKSK